MKIVILSGAGLSAESGIRTFRGVDGLWEGSSTSKVATLKGFQKNPDSVHRFYNERRKDVQKANPNATHFALAKLEHIPEIELFHVTQNIDDLCERAGCKYVHHMHGEVLKCRCLLCGDIFECIDDINTGVKCPSCNFTSEWGSLRPHIVWFGETPFGLPKIEKAIKSCDLFVAIGTSGKVLSSRWLC